jgi:hypothetical protein
LNNLALAYMKQGRYGAARRALIANQKLTRELDAKPGLARCEILLGRIDEAHQHHLRHWKTASQLAKESRTQDLRFIAEYHLLQEARRCSDSPVERAIVRRLTRLANYIPENTPELAEFLALQKSVS